jgi:glycosyltransferase involved in cell wall biosynthesis
MSKMQISGALSVVVPAYNEAPRIGKSLREIFRYLNQAGIDSEVIVVDDGSTDDTRAVAKESFAHAGSVKPLIIGDSVNHGKGYVVRKGLLAASSPVALFSDADLSTPIEEAAKLLDALAKGADIAFGSRAIDRSLIQVRQSWIREQGGKVFNLAVRLATGLPFWDTQCGFKAFRMKTCGPVIEGSTIDRFGFDVELLYVAHLAGLKLVEVPVRWDHNEGSKIDFKRDSLLMLGELRKIRRQRLNGAYDNVIRSINGGRIEGHAPSFRFGDR